MRIGLAYNQKPDEEPPSTSDAFAEWDEPATIDAVARALARLGTVVRLEADASFPHKLALAHPDIVFNMAEGFDGPNREALVPAICEYLRVRYTGSDPLTLGLALHKARAKEVLTHRGVPTPAFACVERASDLARVSLPYPLFVKPVAEGSSKGVFARNLCASRAELEARVGELLACYAEPVLIETYLPGQEFTVAILGNGDDARCLPIVGFDFATLPGGAPPVYSYEAKWVWDTPERPLAIFQCPAPVSDALTRAIERTALAAYRALGCRDWCRVDIRLDAAAVPQVLELNPLPGILPDPVMNSCFPKAARAAGMSYDALILEVVDIAWRRLTGHPAPRGGTVAAAVASPTLRA